MSDLHLAHPASLIKNVWQLEPVLQGARTVIFNGDTAELRLRPARETAARYIDSLRSFCAERKMEVVFINGNHDPDISECDGLQLLDGRLIVTHGDAFFPEITPWGRDARALCMQRTAALRELSEGAEPNWEQLLRAPKLACLRMEAVGRSTLRSRGEWIAAVFRETGHPARAFQVFRAWATLPGRVDRMVARHRPAAQWVAVGHTHLAGDWLRQGRRILNTGSYLPWLNRAVIEISETELMMHRVVLRGRYFQRGAEMCRVTVAGERDDPTGEVF